MASRNATTRRSWKKRVAAVTWLPEFNVVIFAFLLNFPWELLQVPLFARMADAPHWQGIEACARATFGDAMIMLVAYWVVAMRAADREWIAVPRVAQIAVFTALGIVLTVGIEWLALNGLWIHAWRYSASMPVLPGIGVGLSPMLQWLLLPPLVVWFVKRQLTACDD